MNDTGPLVGRTSVLPPAEGVRPTFDALGALPAAVEEAEDLAQAAGHARLVGVHVDLALGMEARHEQRLLLGELADAPGAVARAHAAGLGAAHRPLERGVVDDRVVDADRAGLDAPRDRLAARDVLGED